MTMGLSDLELGRLRMSVGYGTHKTGRPLSPIEVANYFQRSKEAGESLANIAKKSHLKSTSIVASFLQLLTLPEEIRHLVEWGQAKGAIGFSAARELAKIKGLKSQRMVSQFIISDGLNSKEVRQVVQLQRRANRPIVECIREILGMRPKIKRRFVFVGAITNDSVKNHLHALSQTQRDSIFKDVIGRLHLLGATGRLGDFSFTLVGGDRFNSAMNYIGKGKLESRVRAEIENLI